MVMKERIGYIDLIKGFSILWVVLLHAYLRNNIDDTSIDIWLFVKYRMPLFFFLSGIFFRQIPLKEFIMKRINTVIVPFFVFWIIGFLFSIIKYEVIPHYVTVDYVGLGPFSEYAISLISLFYLRPEVRACGVNGPLWFLIALFFIQLLHYLFCKVTKKKVVILFIAVILCIVSYFLQEHKITGLFYLSKICKFYIYYMSGSFLGSFLTKIIDNRTTAWGLALSCLPVVIILPLLNFDTNAMMEQVVLCIRTFFFIPIIFFFFKETVQWKLFQPLKFFGQHSLEVLVTHAIVLSITRNILLKFYLKLPIGVPISNQWLYFILIFIVCVILEYFVIIKLCNRYIPKLIGKQNLFILKQ
jgi:fucose 4-O-acetylase-like acetyltransferase